MRHTVSHTSVVAGYGHLQVLRSVTLSVSLGEIVALTGPNGAGKTTLLRTIAGLRPAIEGRLAIGDRSLDGLSVVERVEGGVATVFGGEAVFGSLTVFENMRVANWLRRAEPALESEVWQLFPELLARGSSRADSLSGGERQMLAIGQALVTRPEFLLIDELTLGLSPARVATMKRIVRQVAAGGTGVLVVEQSAQVVDDLADRVLVMERGLLSSVEAATDGRQSAGVPAAASGRSSDGVDGGSCTQVPEPVPAIRASESSPVLSIRGVSVGFGGVQALSDVSLDLNREEILGIVGSNGAGKTTLLDTCSGYTAVDGGRIELDGRGVTTATPTRRSIMSLGRVFQSAALFPSMSVVEVLSVARDRFVHVRDPMLCAMRLPNVVASEERVERYVEGVLDESGLDRYRDTLVADLPLGVRRQVQLWSALAHEPSVLLLDEPSAGLPAESAAEMGSFVRQLPARRGLSIIIIEHDVPLIVSVADRLIAMHHGRILSECHPGEVLADPRVAAAYLGEVGEQVLSREPVPAPHQVLAEWTGRGPD